MARYCIGFMRKTNLFLGMLVIISGISVCQAIFGMPEEYKKGARLDVYVNKLTSTHTQIPYDYYTLPFCEPPIIYEIHDSIGQALRADKMKSSVYDVFMNENLGCSQACEIKTYNEEQIKKFRDSIRDDYIVHLIIDDLPVSMKVSSTETGNSGNIAADGYSYRRGFPIGFVADRELSDNGMYEMEIGQYYIYNHLHFAMKYNRQDPSSSEGSHVVGFEIIPSSIQHVLKKTEDPSSGYQTCDFMDPTRTVETSRRKPQSVGGPTTILWTYQVTWEETNTSWDRRWDIYLMIPDNNIHWFSIINLLMIVLFLSGMVAMIMMRTLNQDIRTYNETDPEEGAEETGWKLVHGDVFRPPAKSALLSVFVGTGTQVFGMVLVTLTFASLDLVSPRNRGSIGAAALILFVFMGAVGGYAHAKIYKMMKGTNWRRTTALTAFFFPGVVFLNFLIVNIALANVDSTAAVAFFYVFRIIFLWFGISAPLVFVGSYLGFRGEVEPFPCTTHQLPRMIPEQAWYMSPILTILMGGLLPFGAVFIELFFILKSLWNDKTYVAFVFLFVVFFILLITCAEITVVMTYFQLCSEDYHWWWRSFFAAGSSAFYLYAYVIFFFFTKMDVNNSVANFLYFSYMFLLTIAFFVLTGTFGFLTTLFFVIKIYGSIKVD